MKLSKSTENLLAGLFLAFGGQLIAGNFTFYLVTIFNLIFAGFLGILGVKLLFQALSPISTILSPILALVILSFIARIFKYSPTPFNLKITAWVITLKFLITFGAGWWIIHLHLDNPAFAKFMGEDGEDWLLMTEAVGFLILYVGLHKVFPKKAAG